MYAIGTSLINGAALWRIIVASLVGGAGVAIAFGLLLLGVQSARRAGDAVMTRVSGYGLAAVSAAFCVAAIVVGLIAMIDK